LAIAIHEIVIAAGGSLRVPEATHRPEPAATTITITRVAIATPAPSPTPRPTPRPTPPPRVTPSPKTAVAAPRATLLAKTQSGGSRGGPKLEVHLPKLVYHASPVPIVRITDAPSKILAGTGAGTIPTPGPGAGSGTGTGTGSGAGGAQGAGGGTGGSGSGPGNAAAPCGEPIFYGVHARYNPKDGSFDETVRVVLQLDNGQTLSGDFHYPWHYPGEAENPWSPNWHGSPNDPIPAQLPPPGFDLAKEPLAVQLTLKYTLPNGITRLAPCPTAKVP